jgi:hypothetical protein
MSSISSNEKHQKKKRQSFLSKGMLGEIMGLEGKTYVCLEFFLE